ncbi:MAG: aspartate/glutamate racemase family protein [Enterococcus sp.]
MKKIAVIGGTPVDSWMGSQLFLDTEIECVEVPLSKNPLEQTYFQTLPQAEKQQFLWALLKKLKHQKIEGILVYCNSLSASIDFDALASEFQVPIVTPFQIYRKLAGAYQRIGVLAANAQGAAGIERELVQANPDLKVFSVTNLEWVTAVEAQVLPQLILERYGLMETMTFFEKNRVEAILIGCTHFPYFLKEYQQQSALICINPAEKLRETVIDR